MSGAAHSEDFVPPHRHLVWSDEFHQKVNSTPDVTRWSYESGAGGWGNNELETYVNSWENCHVVADPEATDGRALQIEATQDKSGKYYSARIKTEGKVSLGPYGYFECRAKLPAGQGVWPAFWTLGSNITSVGWPRCGEIDILEAVNGQDLNHGSLHGPNNYNPTATTPIHGATTGYHTYGALWEPGEVRFYVDGVLYETQKASGASGWVFNDKQFIILNLAIGGNFPGPPAADLKMPADFRIDYVRVYQ